MAAICLYSKFLKAAFSVCSVLQHIVTRGGIFFAYFLNGYATCFEYSIFKNKLNIGFLVVHLVMVLNWKNY